MKTHPQCKLTNKQNHHVNQKQLRKYAKQPNNAFPGVTDRVIATVAYDWEIYRRMNPLNMAGEELKAKVKL